ncbi:hypothetical protein M2323_000300 [Rhodoblastus acidophilus]|uniref:extensin-like domain-containing protein n=1 Tax=Rhodoblastus acidophilus TaxID=1074 RepID=UPI0022240797|nr:extensin family protein [Rhodoblastus acidophilus]MCW2282539.1 hypothetical protein [Rhodoblastus acidophilus]MCW2331400.1 hypothetical protein [Rhodoblastus acidophilus]
MAALVCLAALGGCGKFGGAERPAWRGQAEAACFARNQVTLSNYIQPAAHEIDGPSICGLTRPLKVTALLGGTVQFNSTQTLDCPMVAELEAWVTETVQPAANARFGQPVAQIDSMGSYSCRGMNNQFGARLSEHAFGNALDVGGFVLADGRKILIVRDWTRGDPQTQAFLRDLHNGACQHFATVLSPGSNAFHYNHIHLDLAMHGMTSTGPRRICKPAPQQTEPPSRKDNLPDAPEIEDDLDIAQAGPPRAQNSYAMRPGPSLAAPSVIGRAAPPSRAATPTELHASRTPAPAPEGDPADFDLPRARR